MKKSLLSLASLALSLFLLGSIANAQEEDLFVIEDAFPNNVAVSDSYIKLLNEYDHSWWYGSTTRYSWDIENSTLKFETPKISDYDLYDSTTYRMYFSPYRVEQLKWDEWLDLSSIYSYEAKWEDWAEKVEFEIPLQNYNLNPSEIYYGFIVPLNDYNVVGTPTPEICFQFDREVVTWWSDCDTLETLINPVPVEPDPVIEPDPIVENVDEDGHGAASDCIWMDLAHLSHTINNGVITVRWTAVEGDIVQIAVFDPNEEVYKSIWAVRMSDEEFSYQMTWDWEYNFKITNGCKDVYYKVDAAMPTPDEPKIVPPATGPAENVLYIAIAAIVLYGAYTLITRKSEN